MDSQKIIPYELNHKVLLGFREHLKLLLNKAYHFFFEVIVYLSVSGKSTATFLVATQSTNEIWVFHLLVKVADKSTPSLVTACYLVDRALLFFTRSRIKNCHHSGDTTFLKYLLDSHIVLL